MITHDTIDTIERARCMRLLATLKQQAIAHGRSAAEVEEGRNVLKAKGCPLHKIAACEFAEMRMFEDIASDVESVSNAALLGVPSADTIALAERDCHCMDCFRYWYREFANTFRESGLYSGRSN